VKMLGRDNGIDDALELPSSDRRRRASTMDHLPKEWLIRGSDTTIWSVFEPGRNSRGRHRKRFVDLAGVIRTSPLLSVVRKAVTKGIRARCSCSISYRPGWPWAGRSCACDNGWQSRTGRCPPAAPRQPAPGSDCAPGAG
jgi:hypothetical protein